MVRRAERAATRAESASQSAERAGERAKHAEQRASDVSQRDRESKARRSTEWTIRGLTVLCAVLLTTCLVLTMALLDAHGIGDW
jgi:hypothetical protein